MNIENIVNIEEAKNLIEKYRSISLEDIKKVWIDKELVINKYLTGSAVIANKIMGFGYAGTCDLCKKCKEFVNNSNKFGSLERFHEKCDVCIYTNSSGNFCFSGNNYKTYKDISEAETPEKLLLAFNERANHIENLINFLSTDGIYQII